MPTLIEQLDELRAAARADIAAAGSEADLEALRVKYLGKKGSMAAVRRGMGQVPAEERPAVGKIVNEAVDEVEALLGAGKERLARAALERELAGARLDVTLPGRRTPRGHRHPLVRTQEDIVAALRRLGFSVAGGPDVELDWFNFTALNFPDDHPARDMQDTFFVDGATLGAAGPRDDVMLRTHTSGVQIRTMLARKPPIRVIMPGTTFRCDSDLTHSPMFNQIEGLYVDRGVSFVDLKGTLDLFVKAIFGAERRTRFRPSFFPFVEPGAECDMSCAICGGTGRLPGGEGCRTCKASGWVEILGAGLVHPNVLANCGLDPETYSGFAFGMGIERVAMLRYGVDDLRHYFENDVRFLAQF